MQNIVVEHCCSRRQNPEETAKPFEWYQRSNGHGEVQTGPDTEQHRPGSENLQRSDPQRAYLTITDLGT